MARFIYVFLVVGVAAFAAAQDHSGTNYNAGDSGRSETRNPDGSVQGQYSYTDPNGKLITIKYRAGKDGYQVEGDHLPKAPAVPQHPAPQAPVHNPHNYQPSNPHGYNPFHNPHVPAHLYQQAPQAPQAPQHPQVPQHTAQNYNPFHNPHVPAHLYQQAPQAPQAPQHPQHPQVPQHTAENYNPFHNPHVPAHLYQQAPQAPQHHQQPQQQQSYNQFPAGTFSGSNNQFPSFNHPNSIPGAPSGGRGPIKVSVSQQPQGFTYNFETS